MFIIKTAVTFAIGLAFATSAHAVYHVATNDYDATADFSTASNPNGVWRYGYSMGDASHYDFMLFDQQGGTAWTSSSYASLGAPGIWQNTSTTTSYGIPPGQLSLHPGPNAYSPTILRFVAPTAGVYQINVGFGAGDSGVMNGGVFLNDDTAAPLAYFSSTDAAPTFSGRVTLAQGAHLDVAVGNNGSFYSGNTPVTFTVNALPVPEPATSLMLGVGVLMLFSISARRRRR